MNAKAGDKISDKARKAYARAIGNAPLHIVDTVVQPKTTGQGGQWFCIDCGELPQNNFSANTHEREKPKHRLAWRSVANNIEEP